MLLLVCFSCRCCCCHSFYCRSFLLLTAERAWLESSGCSYLDKMEGGESKNEEDAQLAFAAETDRVYKDTPETTLVIESGRPAMRVDQTNSFSDTVVWNPWMAKAGVMQDFEDASWPSMLCVEACVAATPLSLSSHETWVGSQTLTPL